MSQKIVIKSTKVKESFDFQISFDVETVKQATDAKERQGPDLVHPMLDVAEVLCWGDIKTAIHDLPKVFPWRIGAGRLENSKHFVNLQEMAYIWSWELPAGLSDVSA